MKRKNTLLFWSILAMMTGVVIVALGGGLFGQSGPWVIQGQHQMFSTLCHQMPERSFWIAGQPMAVCSRCLGIYTGFFAGWMMLPLFVSSGLDTIFSKKFVVIAAIIFNLLDVVGNMLGFWQNTLVSRLVLGNLIGITAAAFFSGSFFTTTINKQEEHYGRVTTTHAG